VDIGRCYLLACYTLDVKTLTVKEFASMGGKARAKKLSAKRRKEIARMGVDARLDKRATTTRCR
jgi:hypothetical protein